jgi:hypothetical protein
LPRKKEAMTYDRQRADYEVYLNEEALGTSEYYQAELSVLQEEMLSRTSKW